MASENDLVAIIAEELQLSPDTIALFPIFPLSEDDLLADRYTDTLRDTISLTVSSFPLRVQEEVAATPWGDRDVSLLNDIRLRAARPRGADDDDGHDWQDVFAEVMAMWDEAGRSARARDPDSDPLYYTSIDGSWNAPRSNPPAGNTTTTTTTDAADGSTVQVFGWAERVEDGPSSDEEGEDDGDAVAGFEAQQVLMGGGNLLVAVEGEEGLLFVGERREL